MARMRRSDVSVPMVCWFVIMAVALLSPTAAQAESIAALGRLEPAGGVIRVAAPSTPEAISGAVLAELHVDEGDRVEAGQLLAVTESTRVLEARVAEARARLALAEQEADAARSEAEERCVRAEQAGREAQRRQDLLERGLASEEETEALSGDADARAASCRAAEARTRVARSAIELARAQVATQEAEWSRSRVLAPVTGHVLEVHARPGEVVLQDGVLELAETDRMIAVAEVWETEVRHVRVGQGATIRSDALPEPVRGTVSKVHMKVGKQDEIGTDPAAEKDARVIEVEVDLEDPAAVASLTFLQVEVLFDD